MIKGDPLTDGVRTHYSMYLIQQLFLSRFLLKFSNSLNRHLGEVWQARFPLLLHYLEQGEGALQDLSQWQSWLLDLATDSARQVQMEDWTLGLCTALVSQLSLYPATSEEKSFSILAVGRLLTLASNRQAVLDHLSSLFLATTERRYGTHLNICHRTDNTFFKYYGAASKRFLRPIEIASFFQSANRITAVQASPNFVIISNHLFVWRLQQYIWNQQSHST